MKHRTSVPAEGFAGGGGAGVQRRFQVKDEGQLNYGWNTERNNNKVQHSGRYGGIAGSGGSAADDADDVQLCDQRI